MTLQRPLGLLIWLGIPALIALYLMKPVFVVRPVSTTYLWRLSERYQKKRRGGDFTRRLAQLLLQIAIVLVAGLLAAGPLIPLPGRENRILVLDISASMNASAGDTTRLDRAKEMMTAAVRGRPADSRVTLILSDGRVLAEQSARTEHKHG